MVNMTDLIFEIMFMTENNNVMSIQNGSSHDLMHTVSEGNSFGSKIRLNVSKKYKKVESCKTIIVNKICENVLMGTKESA